MITSKSFSAVSLNNSPANINHINFGGNTNFIDRINFVKEQLILNQEKCKKELVYRVHKDIIDYIEAHRYDLVEMTIPPYTDTTEEYVWLANRLIKMLEKYVKKISNILDIMDPELGDYIILKVTLNVIDIEYIKGNTPNI